MTPLRTILIAVLFASFGATASADDTLMTLGSVARINTLLLTTDPLDPASSKQCVFGDLPAQEKLEQALQRLGFPAVVGVAEDPDFALPTFTLYATTEPIPGSPARCMISAYATLEMPAPNATFGWPRVVLWQAPMFLSAVEAGENPEEPSKKLRDALQGYVDLFSQAFVSAWQESRPKSP